MHVIPQLQASMAKYEANELMKMYGSEDDGFFIARGSTQVNKQPTVLHKLSSNAHIQSEKQLGSKALKSSTGLLYGKASNMPLSREQMKEIFKSYDSDNDGFLNIWEITKAFGFLGSIIPFYKAHYGLTYADANKDGLISEAELDQLIDYADKVINKK